MAKRFKTSATIGLHVQQVRRDGYFHLYVRPVWVGMTPDDMQAIDRGEDTRHVPGDRIRGMGSYANEQPNGLYYENLTIASQGNDDDQVRHLYGWEVIYQDAYSVDVYKAVRMARTLTTIDKRMDALNDKYQRPASFGAYILRVADIIGATKIVCPSVKERPGYDQQNQILDLSSGAYRIDSMIDAWVNQLQREADQREAEARRRAEVSTD